MAEVVITEFMDEAAVETLRSRYRTTYDPDLWEDVARLKAELATARAIVVRNKTKVDADLLEAGRGLEIVGRLGVGLDNIDLDACAEADVAVKPATGANATAVAEYVLGAAWVLIRGVAKANPDVIAGEWPRTHLVGGELAGRRLGLIGMGSIAMATADRAVALGMSILGFDPLLPPESDAWRRATRCDTLEDLLAQADVVSLHVPLTDDTANLIGAAELSAMKDRAILINTSRGGVVDEEALRAALCAGSIAGAALDVFESEPVDPAGGRAFEDVPNLMLTPHIAGITEESNFEVSALTARNVIEALQ